MVGGNEDADGLANERVVVQEQIALDADLNPEQRRAAMHDIHGHLQIVAGPGTGKTKTLVNRIVHLLNSGIQPEKILVLAFTNRAVVAFRTQLESRVGKELLSRVHLYNFHSFCQSILAESGDVLDVRPGWDIADEVDSLIAADRVLQSPSVRTHPALTPTLNSQAVLRIVKAYKQSLIIDPLAPEEYEKSRSLAEFDPRLMRCIIDTYNDHLLKANMLDYDDILLWGRKVIERHPERTPTFDAVLVDEFQDMAPLQLRLIEKVLETKASLTVVGDPDQSIYAFAGADPHVWTAMQTALPNVTTVWLVENYRSSRQIVDSAGALLGPKKLQLRGQFDAGRPALVKQIDQHAEAAWIADRIQDLLESGTRPGGIAVLHRTSSGLRTIAQELASHNVLISQYNPPVSLTSKYVLPLLVYMRFLATGRSEHLLYLLRNPHRKFLLENQLKDLQAAAVASGQSLWDALQSSGDALFKRPSARQQRLGDFVAVVRRGQGLISNNPASPGAMLQAIHEFANLIQVRQTVIVSRFLEGLFDVIHQQTSLSKASFDRILGYLTVASDNSELQSYEPMDTVNEETILQHALRHIRLQDNMAAADVTVSTVHSAKGLEWNTVFVAGCNDRNFPHVLSKISKNVDDERRLLYVAFTRAKESLTVTYPVTVDYGTTGISRFLTSKVTRTMDVKSPLDLDADDTSYFESLLAIKDRYPRVFAPPKSARITENTVRRRPRLFHGSKFYTVIPPSSRKYSTLRHTMWRPCIGALTKVTRMGRY